MGILIGPNQPQTLTGIETFSILGSGNAGLRPNQPQTLTGIETRFPTLRGDWETGPINLKPLQGLKPFGLNPRWGPARAQSTSNPYRD